MTAWTDLLAAAQELEAHLSDKWQKKTIPGDVVSVPVWARFCHALSVAEDQPPDLVDAAKHALSFARGHVRGGTHVLVAELEAALDQEKGT